MSFVGNKQLELTASWLNTLASAAVIAGVIAPIAAVTYGASTASLSARGLVIGVAAWFAIGLCLHLIA